jgi:2-polyprenyl-3-methyl-5-hydroxy-6-metoxy-1,4-benzoquinol methylase
MTDFDTQAAEWDTPERVERVRAVAAAIRAHVSLSEETRVIDIGSGTGLLGLELLGSAGSVVVADPSEGMVEVARGKIRSGDIQGAEAIVYDVIDGEPPGAPFDLAVSLLMLHHVEDTSAVLRSVHALLAPGGHIALVDLDEEDGSFHEPDEVGIYHQGFVQPDLIRLVGQAGLEDAETRVIGEIDHEGKAFPLFLLTASRG